MSQNSTTENLAAANAKPKNDWSIAIPTGFACLIVTMLSLIWPEESGLFIRTIRDAFIHVTGAAWLWLSLALLVIMFFFMLSPYGKIRFGGKDEKPEFSTFSWFCMTICTSAAGGILFWAICEPMDHLARPPFGIEPLSREAFEMALSFTMFREFYTWPWYLLTALPICYMIHNRKSPSLRISHAAIDMIGEKNANGLMGKSFEVVCAWGLIACNAGVLAVSVPLVSRALAIALDIEYNMNLNIIVLAISTAIFTISTCFGLKKGIQWLSKFNVYIAFIMLGYGLVAGPTIFILENMTYSFGTLLDNFFSIALWSEPYLPESTVAQDWTIFSSIWMVPYAPVCGLFLAKISRGRTVRELIFVLFVASSIGRILIYSIYGGIMMGYQLDGSNDFITIMLEQGNNPALAAVLQALPLGVLVLIMFCLFTTSATATSLDSSALILASSMCKSIRNDQEPTIPNRLFWAFIQSAMGFGIIVIGGLSTMKAFAIMGGAIMLIPVLLVIASWFKMIKEYNYTELKYQDAFEYLEKKKESTK